MSFRACRRVRKGADRSLTDFECGKASSSSESSKTKLVPLRFRSTYLPRTPPEKSYSGRISAEARLEGLFFVAASFMIGYAAGADEPYPLSL